MVLHRTGRWMSQLLEWTFIVLVRIPRLGFSQDAASFDLASHMSNISCRHNGTTAMAYMRVVTCGDLMGHYPPRVVTCGDFTSRKVTTSDHSHPVAAIRVTTTDHSRPVVGITLLLSGGRDSESGRGSGRGLKLPRASERKSSWGSRNGELRGVNSPVFTCAISSYR